jgi:hypothetical protein
MASDRLVTARALAAADFAGIKLPGVYGDLLGKQPFNTTVFVWGPEFVGKTTLVIGACAEWARHVGPVLYVSAEEGHSPAIGEKLERLNAAGLDNLVFATYEPSVGFNGILDDLRSTGAGLLVIDSVSWIDPQSVGFAEFAMLLKEAGVAIIFIGHATKGGNYAGARRLPHAVDAVVEVMPGGRARTRKNRFGQGATGEEVEIPMTAARANPFPSCSCQSCTSCGGVVRSNPTHSGRCAHAKGGECECRCGGRMHGSGVTKTRGGLGTSGRQTKQGRAVMASLTESGTKKVGRSTSRSTSPAARKPAAKKPAPKTTAAKRPTAPKRTPKQAPKAGRKAAPKKGSVAASLAAIQNRIANL